MNISEVPPECKDEQTCEANAVVCNPVQGGVERSSADKIDPLKSQGSIRDFQGFSFVVRSMHLAG